MPMKRFVPVVFAFALFTFMQPATAADGPRAAQWKAVDEAVQKGLPQSAISNLNPIITATTRDKAWPEAVRAIAKKIALEGNIQGNKPEEKILRLEAEIPKAPAEARPVMHAVLAHWYWHYFQQNRWRFMQRTQTAEPPGKDFTIWALPQLFAEIGKQFDLSLAAAPTLKATPIAAWDGLIEKGTMPDAYRPTLYDFIGYQALEFWISGEQAGAKPEDAFELSADSPALNSAEKFLAWKPAAGSDTNAAVLKAIQLYQDLLRFHRNDPQPALAFASADLARLNWARNVAFGEDKDARFKTALEAWIKVNADNEISALGLEDLARVLQQEGDLVAARQTAKRGADVFPNSPGGKQCRNLVSEIESKSASISTERVWNGFVVPPSGGQQPSPSPGDAVGAANRLKAGLQTPVITVHYRNVTNVYFRAYPANWESFLDKRRRRPENLTDKERRDLIASKPVLEWSAALPATPNYQERKFDVPAPVTLAPGFYFIAASHDPQFGEANNLVSLTDIWVSELALVIRTRDRQIEGFVLEANSGEPIAGAEVAGWYLDPNGNRVAEPTLRSDTNGFFSLKPQANRSYLFRARHNGRELASASDLYANHWEQGEVPNQRTVFFTDRAIYRPGQTVQYKGICLEVNQAKDNYQVLAGESVEVFFLDPNGKEIAKAKHRANDYGSFAGSFTAPRDRVMGQMHIEVRGRAAGAAYFNVEEYKRPKFEVTLEAPKTAPKLNDKVSVPGRATSYTGAAVDGAVVKWRVTREVRMPWWWGWWRGGGWPSGESQEIAHGTTRSGTDGAFTVEFVAKPDPKVPAKDEPTFVYSVHADVTDSSGETRSDDRSVRVGYAALEVMLSADDWQVEGTPIEIKITTQTLDGEPQVAEGKLKVHKLISPREVQREPLGGGYQPWRGRRAGSGEDDASQDQSNPNNWPLGDVVEERGFTTDTNGVAKLSFRLPTMAFRVIVETQDRFGKPVTGRLPLRVLKPDAPKLAIRLPQLVAAPKWEVQPGGEFMALWGTGYERGRACLEIEHRNQIIQRWWTAPGRTQQEIKLAVTEAMRGGFTLHVTQVRENRGYLESRRVSVPWINKELELKWEHFVSKLQPGQKETWTLAVSKRSGGGMEKGSDAKTNTPALQHSNTPEFLAAELVATLYDASLDAFAPLNWPGRFDFFREDSSTMNAQFLNFRRDFQRAFGNWREPREGVVITYRHFPNELTQNLWGYQFTRAYGAARMRGVAPGRSEPLTLLDAAPMAAAAPASPPPAEMMMAKGAVAATANFVDKLESAGLGGAALAQQTAAPKPDLSKVTARKNLNETAFFYPQLTSDSNGVVRMAFTMPEALTKWRFLGFAHDRQVRSGRLEGEAFTAKDLMVQPNPPRFLREGDVLEFSVKVSNQSDKPQSGVARLNFFNAFDQTPADKLLGVEALGVPPSGGSVPRPAKAGRPNTEIAFNIPAKESRSFAWRITVPDGCGFLNYKAVAAGGTFSDGEEGAIPVLSRRVFVTESLPLWIRGPGSKHFVFKKLTESGKSRTLRSEDVVVQMVSNPSWYAVMALPYLMEFPHECSEQTFNRFYANTLARFIANSDPRIRSVFDQWKNTPALDSPLEKNQDLKAVMIEETPWLRQAQSESQARRNVGILFDENRLNNETAATLRKLTEMQLQDGRWPWFPGGYANDYITLYIATGFGRLRHLGVDADASPGIRAQARLDDWMREHYERIQQRPKPEEYVPSATDAFYLYGRSFFLKDQPVAPPNQPVVDFFLKQARKYWLETANRQTQGHLAIALKRWGGNENLAIARGIMESLKQRSVSDAELGRFWRDTELSWWWYRAPIETQALMIEAFDEVAADAAMVEDCRVWLLNQKRTQDWKTTKATADAVYALLLKGRDLLASTELVQVSLGGKDFTPGAKSENRSPKSEVPKQPEAGTGFYEVRFPAAEVKPKMGEITVKKVDQGIAWGGVHWQYFEDISKLTPATGTPLKLDKKLFTKVNTAKGPVLEPVKGALAVGDELVVRIILRTDRDMEYVHLKDMRGSGTEPVNVLSRYKYQDGLGYYESTRDVASHFYMDYLPKGTYVFEYSVRIQCRGQYQTGMAEIQCMYAPEFNSHSESLPLVVK
jgi:hypothetical protein